MIMPVLLEAQSFSSSLECAGIGQHLVGTIIGEILTKMPTKEMI